MRKSSVVFFLGGLAALLYETIWARLLTRVLGGHAGATATVLAVFMAGLGIGAFALAPWARRKSRPQVWYAGLEAFVAVWAALSPFLLTALEPVEGFAWRALVAGACLLPPTIAMGATFPWMGRLTIADAASAGRETSRFYAANTFGAAAGAFLAPALVMPAFGLRGGLLAAAGCSTVAAALALTLPATPASASPPARMRWDAFLVVPALFGLSSLALEVLLTRVLITITGASTFAFAVVLAMFLLGIALGSSQARDWLARGVSARRMLSLCGLAVPLGVFAGILLLRWSLGEADLLTSLSNRTLTSESPLFLLCSHALSAALALLAPAIAFGIALPACVAIALERAPSAAREVVLGRVYACNTFGALLGALVAGFVLMPALGVRLALIAALAPCVLAVLSLRASTRTTLAIGLASACTLGVWALLPSDSRPNVELLYHRAGLFEMVAVEEVREPDGARVRSIRLNGKVEASTAPVDVRLQLLLAHIPGLLHGEVEHALVIGAGSGMTAGALLDLPTIESLTLFEIEPAVLPATHFFDAWNNALLSDPRVVTRIADGRHALMRSGERFDLITADPVHPWSRGSSDLYTLEYFRAIASHLAPNGIASQWVPLYELSTDDVRTLAATWCASFGHVGAYLTAYDLALIGSNVATTRDLSLVELPGRLGQRLAEIGVHAGAELAALQVADDRDLRAWTAGVEPMRDDLPSIEFRAPLAYSRGYSVDVLRWCARPEFVERLPSASRVRAREVRELVLDFVARLPAGRGAAAAHYGRRLLALPAVSSPSR